MTMRPKPPAGSLAGKLMLSGALILGSGAYAIWQHRPSEEAATPGRVAKQMAALPIVAANRPQAAAPPFRPAIPDSAPSPAPVAPAPDQKQATPSVNAIDSARPTAADALPSVQPAAPVTLASNSPPEPVPPPASPPPAAAPQISGRYTNGDFTGPSTDTPWGTVQVVARVQNGSIAEIEPIDYPQHRRRSVQINEWALPVLEREVIQAQSANVDIVSQATTTSVGYLQSLAGALAQAKR